jgi:hypothetical protein
MRVDFTLVMRRVGAVDLEGGTLGAEATFRG